MRELETSGITPEKHGNLFILDIVNSIPSDITV